MLPEISARRSLLDPSFRYLSPGREGEKCRPLDHARQIPFIHSDRFLIQSNFSTYRKVYQLFHPSGTHNWVYMTIAHVPLSENANWVPAQFPMKKRRERKKSFFTTRKSSHFSYTRFFFSDPPCAQNNCYGLQESFLHGFDTEVQPRNGPLFTILPYYSLCTLAIFATFQNPLTFWTTGVFSIPFLLKTTFMGF